MSKLASGDGFHYPFSIFDYPFSGRYRDRVKPKNGYSKMEKG
jgi:hypothetical protein